MSRSVWSVLTCGLLMIALSSPASGGGGPENVALVVNRRSWSSRTIANYFQQLRHIPRINVVDLDWTGDKYRTDIDTFRRDLLRPVLKELDARRLSHVDYIVYSSDLPYEIQFGTEKKSDDAYPSGSLTGLTFLYQLSLHPTTHLYAESNTNWYAAQMMGGRQNPTRAFRSSYAWDDEGNRVERPGPDQPTQRYLLSTMLGYTGPRGNTVTEVVTGLQRSAAVDGTSPPGTIYYCRNPNVRSTTRDANRSFEMAVAELQRLKVNARIVDGILPNGAADVQGLMTGVSDFDWKQSRSTILPGAIAEHLTSFGAVFHGASQTPISEWIRQGAAGTSGTVIEPYALPYKFPHPRIHVHYAHGCSLAEAFYQSVNGPHQLLILGDPLCRPWAKIPTVALRGLEADQPMRGELVMQPQVLAAQGQAIRELRVFLDGLEWGHVPPKQAIKLVTTNFSDGFHELRIVAIEQSLIESQGRQIIPLWFAQGEQLPEASLQPQQDKYDWGQPIVVRASLDGATQLEIYHNRRQLGVSPGEKAEFRVDPQELGSGPVTLDVVGVLPGPPQQRVSARPLSFEIGWPASTQ